LFSAEHLFITARELAGDFALGLNIHLTN